MGRTTGSDWLDRYSAGEYEAVWAEMLQLGEALVSAQAYEHARAVAEETMRRARKVEPGLELTRTLAVGLTPM